MASKKGEKYQCEECGLVVVVDDPCGCETVELVCCEVPMKPVKVQIKTKPKTKAKPAAKKLKRKSKPKTKKK